MFAEYYQQDSQEFLTFLLDGLHESLNKVKTKPKIDEQDNDLLPDPVAAELAWKNHKLHNESIIVELFQIIMYRFKPRTATLLKRFLDCNLFVYEGQNTQILIKNTQVHIQNTQTSAAYVLYYTSIDLKTPEFKPSFS